MLCKHVFSFNVGSQLLSISFLLLIVFRSLSHSLQQLNVKSHICRNIVIELLRTHENETMNQNDIDHIGIFH